MRELLDKLILYEIAPEERELMLAAAGGEGQGPFLRHLLELSGRHGLSGDLWHCYVAWLIASAQNTFSLAQERRAQSKAAETLGRRDLSVLRELFFWPWPPQYRELMICMETAGRPSDAGLAVKELAKSLAQSEDEESFARAGQDFYHRYGAGLFGMNRAFNVRVDEKGRARLNPLRNTEEISLDSLIGYETQKQRLRDNTEAFIAGRPANNVLLYGDGGTGKSTSIRAIVSSCWRQGLRIIQVYRHQMKYLTQIIDEIKNRNYRFIIYMDDLSFEDFETEYKYLKAVIEGGLEPRPENVLIYATSNRRHLIKETFKDRNDIDYEGDIHRSDSMEEKLSLAERFGLQIYYGKPGRDEFHRIVLELAKREGLSLDAEKLHSEATKWEIRRGGVSGRSARQLIDYLKGMEGKTQ